MVLSVENLPPQTLNEFRVDLGEEVAREDMEARLVRAGEGEMQQLDRSASESGSENSSLLCGMCKVSPRLALGDENDRFDSAIS